MGVNLRYVFHCGLTNKTHANPEHPKISSRWWFIFCQLQFGGGCPPTHICTNWRDKKVHPVGDGHDHQPRRSWAIGPGPTDSTLPLGLRAERPGTVAKSFGFSGSGAWQMHQSLVDLDLWSMIISLFSLYISPISVVSGFVHHFFV